MKKKYMLRLKIAVYYMILFVILFAVNGCKENEYEFFFSHKSHDSQKIQCVNCHSSGFDQISRAGHEQCKKCHAIIENTPSKDCLKCHKTIENQTISSINHADYSTVEMEHETHMEKGVICDKCHGSVQKEKELSDIQFISMEGCVKCHFPKQSYEMDPPCMYCHYDMDKKVLPDFHESGNWIPIHGGRSRTQQYLCDRCHMNDTCALCHRSTMPEFHTSVFIKRGHGIHASNTPEKCNICHKQDFCISCHQNTKPIYHTPSFRTSKPYTHCGICHLPIQSGNRCIVCHKSAAHNQARAYAPPPPPFVDKSLPCFFCHPVDLAPIRHLYNTIPDLECIFCH